MQSDEVHRMLKWFPQFSELTAGQGRDHLSAVSAGPCRGKLEWCSMRK